LKWINSTRHLKVYVACPLNQNFNFYAPSDEGTRHRGFRMTKERIMRKIKVMYTILLIGNEYLKLQKIKINHQHSTIKDTCELY
jgi:hypothetical protein